MTIAMRNRRSLIGAVVASTMCAGLIGGPAAAGHAAPDDGSIPPDVEAHRLIMHDRALARRDGLLAEPSRMRSAASGESMLWPVDGEVTSTFGQRYGRMHRGIDIGAPTGTPIRAVRDGRVVFSGSRGGYGLTVDIAHSGGQQTRSAHQSELLVEEGDPVARGQIIGRVGSTGSSTGPHLHFEISVRGADHDPLTVLPHTP